MNIFVVFLFHRSAALWTQRPWWWGCWISPLMCWCSDTECRNASIARSASSYNYFYQKTPLVLAFFFSCVIWPIRNILVGLLRPVLFWAVLNHLNFLPSVYRGPEHLPPSQGGKEIGADSALVTGRPRTTFSRAGENHTHTHTQKCFEECEKFNYKIVHCHSLTAIYVALIRNHFQWEYFHLKDHSTKGKRSQASALKMSSS